MARKFNFRYETLLKIRRQREDYHKQIVAERVRQLTAAQTRLASLQHQVAEEEEAIRHGQNPGTIDLQQIVRHRHWLGYLHKNVLETQAAIRGLEGRLAQKRAALAEAMKQRKILEKLKEHRLERHLLEESRRDTRAADDLTTVRFVHDQVESVDAGAEH